MGDSWRNSLNNHLIPEAGYGSEREQDDDPLDPQSAVYESQPFKNPKYQDSDETGLGLYEPQEEIPSEEVAGEEFLETQNPGEALSELQRVLHQDLEENVSEMSRLSITQKLPSISAKGRRRRRLLELAKPKASWQVLKDRPSVYWTERFLKDTTLAITIPAVSRRVEELSRPKRFYLEYFNNNRTSPVWPIPRSTLDYQASSHLKELATPKIRSNIWSINMSEVSQVSRAAQMAVPSPRILQLSKPRAPATLLEEWDPVPKPKPHVSDYNRLLHLALPKAQSDKCIPDRDPRWEVLESTKKAVASPRIISLAKPRVRKDLNEGYDRHLRASMNLPPPRASPKKYDRPRPGL
ncbi:testicular haploid expressed gene protein isoform X2 [Nycticebus coucang]|uniref:testicular haploid expressed gene protein isoform X2 n=1 Tax=Nycticebus coucang TaxID=9470 RepID=UPI00234C1364|nr:testicular haploid expressed gene protein isoform X2 [Nycticebus coucang]